MMEKAEKEFQYKYSTHRIETIINQMLEILAHTNLTHQFVFIAIHSSQLANMREYIL